MGLMLRELAVFDVYALLPTWMPPAASIVAAPNVTVAVMLEEHVVPVTEPFAQYVKVVGAPV